MKANQLTLWVMGALLLGLVTLYGINTVESARRDAEATNRLDRIESKVDAIYAQYGRIASMDDRLGRIERQMDQIYQKLR